VILRELVAPEPGRAALPRSRALVELRDVDVPFPVDFLRRSTPLSNGTGAANGSLSNPNSSIVDFLLPVSCDDL
jgi:hypothetical protein